MLTNGNAAMGERPRTALILAAGRGTRIQACADGLPKALLQVGNERLIERQIVAFKQWGVERFVITTGYEKDQIEDFIRDRFPDLAVTYVFNEHYDSTNYIYSLWLAGSYVSGSLILAHGDLSFDHKVMQRVMDSPEEDLVVVRPGAAPEKDFKAEVHDHLVRRISVHLSGANMLFCLPLYKLSEAFFRRWLCEIDLFVRREEVNCYAENALNNLLGTMQLHALPISDLFFLEVDTLGDLTQARRIMTAQV